MSYVRKGRPYKRKLPPFAEINKLRVTVKDHQNPVPSPHSKNYDEDDFFAKFASENANKFEARSMRNLDGQKKEK